MDSDLCGEQEVPSAVLTGINFSVSVDKEKVCLEKICVASEVTDPKLGLPNPSSECLTCGAKDLKHCEGHFGVIQFPYTILHPYYLSEVVQILNKVCPACKSLREDLWIKGPDSLSIDQPKGCKYCVGNSLNWYPPMKFKVLSEDIFRLSAIMVEVNENVLRKFQKRRKEALPADYWDFLPKDSHQEESGTRPNRRILSHAQVHFLLKAIDPKLIRKFILRPDSLFLNYFPVTPNSHRVTELTYMFSSGQRLFFDERTGAYKKLVDFRGTSNELSSRVLGCLKISKLHTFKSSSKDATTALLKNEDSSNMVGLRYMKDVLLGKRNDSSFRTVVIGDRSLKLSEIGIPCHIAESLQISENLNNWNWDKLISSCDLRLLEKGEIHVRRKNSLISLRRISDLRMGDIISRPLKDGDILLINRPPSIHPHSLIALSVKVLPISSVVSINPICCSPFRGDFDGDCFHGYIPQSIEARVELHELVALDRQLTNWLSGRNLLCLGQDSLTAAHLIKEDGFLLNKYQMQQLKMYCPYELPPPALVKAPRLNSSVWTGKQLFSMLLPPGFNYYFSQNGVCIINGELTSSSDGSAWLRDNDGNLFQSLVKYDKSMVLNFLYAAQEVLCDWLSDRGFSISLSDLYLSSDLHSRENLMDEISWGLLEAEQTCNFKQLMVDSCRDLLAGNDEESQNVITFDVERLCYEKQGSAVLSQASVDAFKQVFRDIQTLAFKYASKENSLLAMYKAGSKGSLPKLVQHSMCLGLQHSLVPLSFRFPHQLSCAAWNKQKRCSDGFCTLFGECPIDDGPRQEDSFCISVTVVKKSKDSSVQLDTVRGLVMPFLLRAVIKGFPEIKKVDILWKDRPKLSKSYDSRGELYLRVSMSEEHGTRTSWNALMDGCLPIMDMIDWARSYPDNIHHFCSANGIDAGWKLFLNNLDSAISDVGKTILPEHLLLIANCLSATGEFVGLSSRGLAQQRKHASVVSPFTQACFSNPSTCFVKAAKAGVTDDLQGSIDALAWGKPPCFGTGGQFDIIYSWRDNELYQPVDVYDLLNSIVTPLKQNVKSDLPNSMNIKSDKYGDRSIYVHSGSISLGLKKLEGISRAYLRTVLTWKDIQKLYHASKKILNKYPIDHRLNEGEKKILMMALYFHPQSYEKIGTGAQYIKIGYHPEYKGTRCFHLVRTDGTTEDFSYRKCVLAALDSIAPEKAKLYRSKWLEQQDYE
ncbi:DNA-directed RNA polymerase IV subunit 1 [Carica papaya]|uniref:DNA-directed RNA polymerase IV subunit 1 n=1 Tax=Carica papaya TaxID=3649 RepID=UPI000B8D1362|nr:DNA-directed RNA polymerase IV subunit 1 [Carica papaya]